VIKNVTEADLLRHLTLDFNELNFNTSEQNKQRKHITKVDWTVQYNKSRLHSSASLRLTITQQNSTTSTSNQRRAIKHKSLFKRGKGKFLTISPTNKNKQKSKCSRLNRPFPITVRGSPLSR